MLYQKNQGKEEPYRVFHALRRFKARRKLALLVYSLQGESWLCWSTACKAKVGFAGLQLARRKLALLVYSLQGESWLRWSTACKAKVGFAGLQLARRKLALLVYSLCSFALRQGSENSITNLDSIRLL